MKKRQRGQESKRGLSPVIASVLLILLVIVLASFIFLWARGFISEQIEKFGQPIETLCDSISFDAQIVQGSAGADALNVLNTGNTDLYQLDVRMTKGGETIVATFKFEIPIGTVTKGDIYLRMKDGSRPEKIELYPAIIGTVRGKESKKIFTCIDKGKILDLQDLVG